MKKIIIRFFRYVNSNDCYPNNETPISLHISSSNAEWNKLALSFKKESRINDINCIEHDPVMIHKYNVEAMKIKDLSAIGTNKN